MDLQRACEILELDKNASLEEIKQAYRDLVGIWHPDRHADNPRRYEKAQEKMKELNAANDYFRAYCEWREQTGTHTTAEEHGYREQTGSRTAAEEHGYEEGIITTCPNCHTKNRIRPSYDTGLIRCGKCKFILYGDEYASEYDSREERIPCGDGECIGIIGSDGRCTRCGKTLEQGKRTNREKAQAQAYQQHAKKTAVGKGEILGKILVSFTFGIVILIFIVFGSYESGYRPPRSKPFPKKPATVFPLQPSTKYPPYTSGKKALSEPEYTPSYDGYYTKEYFSKAGLNRTEITLLQMSLAQIGYNAGKADGIIGNRTLAAAKQFAKDFEVKPGEDFVTKLWGVALYNALIAEVHPDWRKIFMNRAELVQWTIRQPLHFAQEIETVLLEGSPRQMIRILDCYKFDKENPPPLPLPSNGIISSSFDPGEVYAPLKIITRHPNRHHYIKLVTSSEKKEILTAFVRGGTTIKIHVPYGKCELKYAAGEKWYGERFLFGPSTAYEKSEKILNFRYEGGKARGYYLELFLQPHGNLETPSISPLDF